MPLAVRGTNKSRYRRAPRGTATVTSKTQQDHIVMEVYRKKSGHAARCLPSTFIIFLLALPARASESVDYASFPTLYESKLTSSASSSMVRLGTLAVSLCDGHITVWDLGDFSHPIRRGSLAIDSGALRLIVPLGSKLISVDRDRAWIHTSPSTFESFRAAPDEVISERIFNCDQTDAVGHIIPWQDGVVALGSFGVLVFGIPGSASPIWRIAQSPNSAITQNNRAWVASEITGIQQILLDPALETPPKIGVIDEEYAHFDITPGGHFLYSKTAGFLDCWDLQSSGGPQLAIRTSLGSTAGIFSISIQNDEIAVVYSDEVQHAGVSQSTVLAGSPHRGARGWWEAPRRQLDHTLRGLSSGSACAQRNAAKQGVAADEPHARVNLPRARAAAGPRAARLPSVRANSNRQYRPYRPSRPGTSRLLRRCPNPPSCPTGGSSSARHL